PHVCTLSLHDALPISIGFNMTKWPVERRGRPIGRVTSAIYSPRLKKNIGYAIVPSEHADLGNELIVLHPDGPRTAVIVKKPFIRSEEHTSELQSRFDL